MMLYSKIQPAERHAKKEAKARGEKWGVYHNRGAYLAAPLSPLRSFPFPGGRERWELVWPKSSATRRRPNASWIDRGAAPDDYLVFYEPGRTSSGGWYVVDVVRGSGDVGNEVAAIDIVDFPTKGDAMGQAILAAHEHAGRKGVQSAVMWRVGHDGELSQIGHVGASHREPVVANPGWGDEDEDDEEAEGDLRYANPRVLARRLKNAF